MMNVTNYNQDEPPQHEGRYDVDNKAKYLKETQQIIKFKFA